MSLKYVLVPAPIAIAPTLSWTFSEALTFVLDRAPEFQKPLSRVRLAVRVLEAFAEQQAQSVVELREEDWQALRDLVEQQPLWGSWELRTDDGKSTPLLVPPRTFLAFASAITDATSTPPPGPDASREP